MQLLITYNEYCDILGITPEGTTTPNWFNPTQLKALTIISNDLAQSHLFPLTKIAYDSLKPFYKKEVLSGIAYEIQFINDNSEIFESPFISNTSIGVGEFNKGPMHSGDIKWLLNHMCPVAREFFMNIGWCWASLNKKLKYSDYYDDADYYVNWGKIGGDILLQLDLISMFMSPTLEIDENAVAHVKVSKEVDNTIVLKEDGLYVGYVPYELPIASETQLGGIRVGNNLSITTDGMLSATAEPYELPIASDFQLGGVKVGNGLSVDTDGTLSTVENIPTYFYRRPQFFKKTSKAPTGTTSYLATAVHENDCNIAFTSELGNVVSFVNYGLSGYLANNNNNITSLNCENNNLNYVDVVNNIYLQTLICSNNLLTSLDVSKNDALKYLNCGINKIETLDVLGKRSLETLQCSSTYSLKNLKVAGCVNLKTLVCGWAEIKELDVSNCPLLERFDCGYNNLTTLNVSDSVLLKNLSVNNNPLLTEINISSLLALEIFNAFNCSLSSLDLSQNTKLKTISLSNNNLTNIDVTSCVELGDLSVSSNNLYELDVSKNLLLYSLGVANNSRLANLDLTKNIALSMVLASGCTMPSLDLSNCPKLNILNFSASNAYKKLYLPAKIINQFFIQSASNLGDIYTKAMSGVQDVTANATTKKNINIHRPTGSIVTFSSTVGIVFTYIDDNN